MYGGAITLANRFESESYKPDVILCSDMLDLATYLGLIGTKRAHAKVIIYMHENQLTYPWSEDDQDTRNGRDRHYAFMNYTSCLTADEVQFNSLYHKESFLSALPEFLNAFPDYQELSNVDLIRAKSKVSPILLDLQGPLSHLKEADRSPLILWNHRWEYDKGPEEFFEALIQLKKLGYDFRLAVTGESYQHSPTIFNTAKEALGDRIMHWGYVDSRSTYMKLLREADILPISSRQDFFGISIVEAIDAGVFPLLPKRLSYPELLTGHESHLYEGRLLPHLVNCLKSRAWAGFKAIDMSRYSIKTTSTERPVI
jgi:glycosyltransferase involved in cell wall biosynthesis